MANVSAFDMVRLLVHMEAGGLPAREYQQWAPMAEACFKDGWILADGAWGWVISGRGYERLAGFRALLAPADDDKAY